MEQQAHIGLIGLAVMGENLALNMERNGFTVAVGNRTAEKVDRFMASRGRGRRFVACRSVAEMATVLRRPRKFMLMIRAGNAVDECIEQLLPFLEPGDMIVDGGNSHFTDTIRRTRFLEERGVFFSGVGISGGEEGALNGPAIMAGGAPEAWAQLEPIFQVIAARTADGARCCGWMGRDGAGHYVKMVHNGIEYGDMQLICEAYGLLKTLLGLSAPEIGERFRVWNTGELDSYLMEITADILSRLDPETGAPMVDVILDAAGQKGTGKWTGMSALELNVPAPTLIDAVLMRFLSAEKEERLAAAQRLNGPAPVCTGDRETAIEDIRRSLYAAKICSYAQGFRLLRAAGTAYGWDLKFGEIAGVWRGGCIIRARFLDDIRRAFEREPGLENLLLDEFFRKTILRYQESWRRVTAQALLSGIAVPGMTGALSWLDGCRSAWLPVNLLQAQRDYFGAHTYERTDRPRGEFFHTDWNGDGAAVPIGQD